MLVAYGRVNEDGGVGTKGRRGQLSKHRPVGTVLEIGSLSEEFLHVLREAGTAVRAELEYFTHAPYLDAASLNRVERSAAELAGQATSLANMLRSRGADAAPIAELVALSRFFRDAEDQIGSLHAAARQAGHE